MPCKPFRVDQGPEETESQARKGNTRHQEAADRRGQVDGPAGLGYELDPPGHHSKGLAASHPESNEKTGCDTEKEALKPNRAGRDCLTLPECQDGESRQHPESGIQ